MNSNQGNFGKHHQKDSNQQPVERVSWVCPDCETVNTEDVCLLCGYQKTDKPSKKKSRKKPTIKAIALWLLILLLPAACFGVREIYFLNVQYEQACSLMEQGQYNEAYNLFGELEKYRNSTDMQKQTQYNYACSLLEAEQYDQAYQLFCDLGEYLDSKEMQNHTRYKQACNLLKQSRYNEACRLFGELGEYQDSTDLQKACKYAWAEHELALGNYTQAQQLFSELENYQDSQTQKCYAKALQLESEDKINAAIAAIAQIQGDPKVDQLRVQLKYTSAKLFWKDKSYSNAYRNLSDVGDYEDAEELLPVLIMEWAEYVDKNFGTELFFDVVSLDLVWNEPLIRKLVNSRRFEWARGIWNSEDGQFLIINSDTLQYSFPKKEVDGEYREMGNHETGEYYMYKNIFAEINIFRITPVGPDTAEVYCYANKKTYTMYRYRQ